MTSQANKAKIFRDLHKPGTPFVLANASHAGEAKVLADIGFKALATTSAGAAFTLGLPDGAMGRDEALVNASAIVSAVDLPVSADLENGYGHKPEDTAETIALAAKIGLVGGSIEDATGEGHAIYPLDVAVERIKAAVAAARALDFPFTLTARAENFLRGVQDLDDTIARLKAFEAAGADVLFAPGLPDLAALKAILAAITKPFNLIIGPATIKLPMAEIAALGVARISVGSSLARVSYGGLIQAARAIHDQGDFTGLIHGPAHGTLNALMAKTP